MSRKRRENIVIYGSLIAAIACLTYAGIDYYKGVSDDTKVQDEIKEAFKEMATDDINKDIKVPEEEPTELQNVDKATIIINQINAIKDRYANDDLLNYYMIRSWGAFEILNITYQKQITDNYYMYLVDIKIPNKEAQLPTTINNDLSTEEYNVITLKTFITNNNGTYSFKHFEQ